MNTEKIRALTTALDDEMAKLADLRKKAALLTLNGHQESITVTVNGKVSLGVTTMDRSYAQRCIRGREMILLGVKLAMSALIEDQEAVVKAARQAIADEVKGK
jgi:hypothetical protein